MRRVYPDDLTRVSDQGADDDRIRHGSWLAQDSVQADKTHNHNKQEQRPAVKQQTPQHNAFLATHADGTCANDDLGRGQQAAQPC